MYRKQERTDTMDIGEEQRKIRVEPATVPVPQRTPAPAPRREPVPRREPTRTPERTPERVPQKGVAA